MKKGNYKRTLYKFNGEMLAAAEIAERLGMKTGSVYARLKRGQSLEDPVRENQAEKVIFMGVEYKSVKKFFTTVHISPLSYYKAKNGGYLAHFMNVLEEKIKLRAEGKNEEADRLTFDPKHRYITAPGRPRVKPKQEKTKAEKKPVNYSIANHRDENAKEKLKDQLNGFYDPDYEPLLKVLEKYGINKKTSDFVLTKHGEKYDIVKKQIGAAKYNFIRRTHITAYILECQHKHKEADIELARITGVEVVKDESKMSLEELKKAHPLVKDERFFKLSYFPTITSYTFLTECNYINPEDRRK